MSGLGSSPMATAPQRSECCTKVFEIDVHSCSETCLQVCFGRENQVRLERRVFISSGTLCVTCGVFYGQSQPHTSWGRHLAQHCVNS